MNKKQSKPAELQCPRCFSHDIVPSMPRGLWDTFMEGWDRVPKHCRYCGKRFFVRLEPSEDEAETEN